MSRVGKKCVPYFCLGNRRLGVVITDYGHVVNVEYSDGSIDQVSASLANWTGTVIQLELFA